MRALVIWNGKNVFFFKLHNSIKEKFCYGNANVPLYLFRKHAMSFYGLETWSLKLHKKCLNNTSEVYHKAFKRICGRNSYDNNNECLEYVHFPTYKHFLDRKPFFFIKDFSSKSPCFIIHKHCLKYNFVFRNSLESFFSENYQVISMFDNPLCSILS